MVTIFLAASHNIVVAMVTDTASPPPLCRELPFACHHHSLLHPFVLSLMPSFCSSAGHKDESAGAHLGEKGQPPTVYVLQGSEEPLGLTQRWLGRKDAPGTPGREGDNKNTGMKPSTASPPPRGAACAGRRVRSLAGRAVRTRCRHTVTDLD